MQKLFEWSGHSSWEIRGIGLTSYVEICKGCLSDQDIPPEKLEALDLLPIQRLFEWSGYPSRAVRGAGLTLCVGTCKDCLSDQDIPPEKSETLDSPPMLENAKVDWVIKTSLLKNQSIGLTTYVRKCKGWLSNQDIPPNKSEALDSHPMLEHAKFVSGHSSWEIRNTQLTLYVRTW